MTTEMKPTNVFVLRRHINSINIIPKTQKIKNQNIKPKKKLIQIFITIKQLIIMENQQQEQSCEKIEVVEMNINLRYDLFQLLIADSKYVGKSLQLNPKALNDHLAKELGALENETIKITHKTSKISKVLERADSKYFSAHGFCSQSNLCKVTYKFKVAKEPLVNDYVPIETLITGKYL
jgi:hypothetical protein